MSFLDGYKPNFQTLQKASSNGDLAVVECQDRRTKKTCAVVCAINRHDGEYQIVPLARMFDGNPYDELNPPDPEGGFIDTK